MFEISGIRIEHALAPVITDNRHPRFSYTINCDRRDSSLRSARIRVNGWEADAKDQLNLVYQGPELKPFSEYSIELEAESCFGESASLTTSFSTGRLGQSWNAKWISDPALHTKSPVSPAPLVFRRRFTSKQSITRICVFATAMGIYDLYLDGKRINDDYFSPGFTNYAADLQYTVNELKGICAGEHEFKAVVASGWACGRTTHVDNTARSRSMLSADRPSLLCELRFEYEDGSLETIGTDESFEVSQDGPLRFADWFDGEVFDARRNSEDMNWSFAREEKIRLRPRISVRYGLPVTAHEAFAPAVWIETPSGELIADFGQNIAGVVSFSINAENGQEIVFRHAEALENGELYIQNLRSAKQQLRYICKDGLQSYSPRFTYMGFRYVGIRGIKRENIELKAIAVYSDLEDIGSFRCSNDDLNRLQSNLKWSGKDNFVDIPTDCPQRDERQGWTGDIALFSPTACFNFNMDRFLEKWLQDLKTEQNAMGSIPFVIPSRKGVTPVITTSCWGDSCILVPWALYCASGDRSILERQYNSMKRYLGDVRRWAALSVFFHGSPYILKLPFQFGDWCAPYGSVPDWLAKGPWTGTAYFFRSAKILSRIAAILGKANDSRRYNALAEKIRSAFLRVFTDGCGRIKNEFQTAYVLPLAFGLAEGEVRKTMAERLCTLVKENGMHVNTGFTATPFILFALCDAGYKEEACQMLLQETEPSWLYQIRHGATTMWEQWSSVQKDGSIKESSLNHYAYGAVGDFLYRRVCGLEPIEPGYRSFAVKPDACCGLSWAEISHKSPFGMIKVRWERNENCYRLYVTVPFGTTCRVTMPGGEEHTIGNGEYEFEELDG